MGDYTGTSVHFELNLIRHQNILYENKARILTRGSLRERTERDRAETTVIGDKKALTTEEVQYIVY